MNVDVVIPALNEALSIERVVRSIPCPPVREIIVADNGSHDGTGDLAARAGARVVREEERGYGAACLAALRVLGPDSDIVVFMDADGSDEPREIPRLIDLIERDEADMVIGSRTQGRAEPGSLSVPQQVGNLIASTWLKTRFGQPTTDLGPFRAVRRSALERLEMGDRDYGWTVEMQIKAAQRGLRYAEISVPYYRRVGESKVSGTVRGVLGASRKIIGWLAYHDARDTVRRWMR